MPASDTSLLTSTVRDLVIGAALVVIVTALAIARRKVQQTTLVATWWWALTACLATGGVELLAAGGWLADEATLETVRYAAGVLLLCPTISLVGAKRPQDGPWNFVVVSLWAILALPAAEALFLNRGQPVEIGGFRGWLLVTLVLVTLAGTLPTRHAVAALCTVAAQLCLLNDYLPYPLEFTNAALAPIGLLLLALAATAVALQRAEATRAAAVDRLWLDFRDHFGLFWGLRVQERLQAAAKMYQWPVTLSWTGWTTLEGRPLQEELPPDVQRSILVTFRGLLRRFVSNEWIDRRLREKRDNSQSAS